LRLSFTAYGSRCITIERLMHPMAVVVLPEILECSFNVLGVPEEGVIKVFAPYCSNQSLNEGMR
jgi:hypothetical protein